MLRGGSLMQYAGNKYSQNGEDGVFAEIARRLALPSPGTFVEFGVGNGRDLSNTLALAELGWRGVWIEHNLESCEIARQLGDTFGGRVTTLGRNVGLDPCDYLDKILDEEAKLPRAFDYLSIDVDSVDLQIWETVRLYRPRVVLIEINSGIALGIEHVHGEGRQGNSFTSMVQLGRDKKYTVVCHTGNLFFVDDALVGQLGLPAHEIDDPDCLFNDMWARWAK